jgi:hypothetical protein
VKVAGPVAAAAAELVWVLGIVVAVIAGGAAIAFMVALASRWRRRRPDAARTSYPHTRIPVRAAPPLPQPPPAIERPPEVHYHFHISAEDAGAIIERHRPDG